MMQREQGYRRGSSFCHVNDGFYYHCDRERNGTRYFRCILAYSMGCPGRAILREGFSFEDSAEHNHPPSIQYAQIRRDRHNLVTAAGDLMHATVVEVLHEGNNVNTLFTYRNMGPAMERARMKAYPDCPTSIQILSNILSTDRFRCITATFGFADNLFQGVINNAYGASILFASQRCVQFLKIATFVFCFSLPFKVQGSDHEFQIHCIGTVWDETRLPLAWLLLDSAAPAVLVAGLTLLRSKLLIWQFQTVVCMDRSVEAESYSRVFNIKVRYSLNNYIADIAAKTKELGICYNELQTNEEMRKIVHQCCVLPLLPQDLIYLGHGYLHNASVDNCNNHPAMNALLQYALTEWLQNPQRGPIFSMCGSVLRTTSASEEISQNVAQKFERIERGTLNFYRVIKYLVELAEISHTDISSVSKCERAPSIRRSLPLSNDEEIVVLTSGLLGPMLTVTSCTNLLSKASAKLFHVIDDALKRP